MCLFQQKYKHLFVHLHLQALCYLQIDKQSEVVLNWAGNQKTIGSTNKC